MLNPILSLAQASYDSGLAEAVQPLSDTGTNPLYLVESAIKGRLDILCHPSELLSTLEQLHPVWAAIFVFTGALSVANGYRWRKGIVLLLAGLVGVGAGFWLGDQLEGAHTIAASALGILFAVLALPGLRFAVALFGGLAGAFVGANIWTASGADPELHFVGTLLGLTVLGMLAFMAFKLVIVAFTSIGGATLLTLGGISAMLEVEAWRETVSTSLYDKPRIVPLIVAVAAVIGFIIQQGGGVKGLVVASDSSNPKQRTETA